MKQSRWMKKLISAALAVTLVFSMIVGGTGSAAAASQKGIIDVYKECGDYLYKTVSEPTFGSIGGEWAIYGLAKSGYNMSDAYIKKYQKTVEKAVQEGFNDEAGVLDDRKYTEYSRVIIAYAELGLDPTNICGYNMVEKLADFDKVVWQGINGPIFALRALDAGNYEIPKTEGIENVTTRQKLVEYILDLQLDDGGWTLMGDKADTDITAMAVESLAPYYALSTTLCDRKTRTAVRGAVDKAVACLSRMQGKNGTFSSWGAVNSESCAQVICALSSIGINPNTDKKFIKNGKSVVDALLSFYDSKVGGFRHVNKAQAGYKAQVNQMATEQAYYALAAYKTSVPNRVILSSITKKNSTTIEVKWKRASVGSGYQIMCAANKSFTFDVRNAEVRGRKSVSWTTGALKKGNTYYVKIRAYKVTDGNYMYGQWSTVKKIKI